VSVDARSGGLEHSPMAKCITQLLRDTQFAVHTKPEPPVVFAFKF
jgi:hypothetical protein